MSNNKEEVTEVDLSNLRISKMTPSRFGNVQRRALKAARRDHAWMVQDRAADWWMVNHYFAVKRLDGSRLDENLRKAFFDFDDPEPRRVFFEGAALVFGPMEKGSFTPNIDSLVPTVENKVMLSLSQIGGYPILITDGDPVNPQEMALLSTPTLQQIAVDREYLVTMISMAPPVNGKWNYRLAGNAINYLRPVSFMSGDETIGIIMPVKTDIEGFHLKFEPPTEDPS